MLIDRGIILELLAKRTLFPILDLLHKISSPACLLHLELAEPYEILCLAGVRVTQRDPCLLRLGKVLLIVPGELYSVIIIIVFVPVGLSAIYIAVADRKTIR